MGRPHPLLGRGLGRLLLLLFLLSSHHTAGAQSFTQHIQQNVGGTGRVTIHQDDAITELVNGRTATPARPSNNNNTGTTNRQRNGGNDNQQPTRTEHQEDATSNTPVQNTDSVNTTLPRRTRKMAGYRVQPFVGGSSRADRVRAEQTGTALQTLFPGHRVYVHFLGGKWTCRLGDFRTISEAKEVLDELVKMGYDRAIMVRGQVNVPY